MSAQSAQGISLWLEPKGPSRARFAGLIRSLAQELGGAFFEPHVTLLGGLTHPEAEVLERARALVARLARLEVRLTRAGTGSEYFHYLFFEAGVTRELSEAHAAACKTFGVPAAGYQPHLSVAYADPTLHDPEQQLRRLPRRAWGRFRVDALSIVSTEGPPADWSTLARLRFEA